MKSTIEFDRHSTAHTLVEKCRNEKELASKRQVAAHISDFHGTHIP